jgi:LL-diaminopimelate aminotransferase
MEELARAVTNPDYMKYPLVDFPELIESVRNWYDRRYGVKLERENITSLCGSQDGLAHIGLAMCDPGDVMLIPDPGYPIFINAAYIASAKNYYMPLYEENGFLPDFEKIPATVAHNARMMILSYPMNPVGAMAPDDFYERAIRFAKQYGVMILHDNAYSELTFDGKIGGSFLKFKGASDVGVEFNSLSKSYNMTGLRISFALGNKDVVKNLAALKSHLDYGVFRPVQRAAIAALDGPQDGVAFMRNLYEHRRDLLVEEFSKAGWSIRPPEGTMFVFAKIPAGYTSSMEFAIDLLEKTGVLVVPGVGFGPRGEGYVRLALSQKDEEIVKAAKKIKDSGMLA